MANFFYLDKSWIRVQTLMNVAWSTKFTVREQRGGTKSLERFRLKADTFQVYFCKDLG